MVSGVKFAMLNRNKFEINITFQRTPFENHHPYQIHLMSRLTDETCGNIKSFWPIFSKKNAQKLPSRRLFQRHKSPFYLYVQIALYKILRSHLKA